MYAHSTYINIILKHVFDNNDDNPINKNVRKTIETLLNQSDTDGHSLIEIKNTINFTLVILKQMSCLGLNKLKEIIIVYFESEIKRINNKIISIKNKYNVENINEIEFNNNNIDEIINLNNDINNKNNFTNTILIINKNNYYTVYLLFVGCLIFSNKFQMDIPYNNKSFITLFGLNISTLYVIELSITNYLLNNVDLNELIKQEIKIDLINNKILMTQN